MITPDNITTARRLLADWPAANAARIAKDRKPYLAWLREAKPVAGFYPNSRPVGGVVVYSLARQVECFDRRNAHAATAKPLVEAPDFGGFDNNGEPLADTLPPPPSEIIVTIRPGRMAEIEDATKVADYQAARSPIVITARTLRQYAAELREKAKRHAAFVGVDEEAKRLLLISAHLGEAADMLDTHATPDQDNG